MFKNYITDQDLLGYYPQLKKELSKDSSSYRHTIAQAFSFVSTELFNKGIEPRKIMIPLKLTENVPSNKVNNAHRMVINVTTVTGIYSVGLLGSNDNTTWDNVCAYDGISNVDTYTVKFEQEYKYYKYFVVATDAGTFVANVELVETTFDNVIIFKAIEMIFRNGIKENGDIYHVQNELFAKDYETALKGAKYYYDNNDNQIIDIDGVENKPTKFMNVTFTR